MPLLHPQPCSPGRRGAALAWALTVVLGLAALGCSLLMTQRIAAYRRAHPAPVYAFQNITSTSFVYAGRSVLFTQEKTPGGEVLQVRYGEETLSIPASVAPRLPEGVDLMTRQGDWMRLLRCAQANNTSLDELRDKLRTGQAQDILALVTRTPLGAAGEESPAQDRLRRHEWVYAFYRFRPEGGFETQRLRFAPSRKAPPAGNQLREGTWQYAAALLLTPPGSAPTPKFLSDGLRAAGWTLPAATLAFVGMIASIVINAAPRRVR